MSGSLPVANSSVTVERPYRSTRYRLINWGGTFLRFVGVPLAPLEETTLLAEAQRTTGLEDFGDENFRVPLHILLDSLNKEANLNFMGRTILQKYILQLLINRLKIQEELTNNPEIAKVEIKNPLFILGLPRSGTTLLHNLLCQDSSSRWLHLWEMYNPCPPPDYATRETDPRIEEAEKLVTLFNALAPQLATIHSLDHNAPEECNVLFEHCLAGILFELRTNIPSYSEWLFNQDLLDSYRYYRQQLQLFSSKWSGRWVLKAPFHLNYLSSLITVFPDARIIYTHRNPLKVLPSLCSLSASIRGIYTDELDFQAIGQHWFNWLAKATEKSMQMRQSIPAHQIYDLNYPDLVSDPTETVRQIYEYFGYEFNSDLENNLKQYMTQNPQHKHGVHRYSLEQFGLEANKVAQTFENYCLKFNLSSETK